MLVFCEDCGAKHNIDEKDVADAAFQLRCNVCDFLITAKSLPKPKVVKIDPTMDLSCSHDVLAFGTLNDDIDIAQTMILAAIDGRKVELTGALETELQGNVTLSSVSAIAFRVGVLSSSHVCGPYLAQYDGPGVIITDTISHFKKIIPLSFNRG